MKRYLVYDKESGKILTALQTANDPQVDVPDGCDCIESDENFINKKIDIVSKKLIEDTSIIQKAISTKNAIRKERNYILLTTDWTQMPDSPLSNSKKAEWATYRQQLRDLPSNYTDSDSLGDVVWPTTPE